MQGLYDISHVPPYITHGQFGIEMHHYSYVFPSQVRQKVQYYKAAVSKNNCIDDYFDRVYCPWVTGSSVERSRIEDEFEGVHEFKPEVRGECRTATFKGNHPKVIQQEMSSLKERFKSELRGCYNGC